MNHSPNDTASHPKTIESEIYYDYSEIETEILSGIEMNFVLKMMNN
jgi:hypothetical protein